MDWVAWVTTIASTVSGIATILFITFNHLWTAWRNNAWGRHVMAFSYVMTAIFALTIARNVFGEYPWRRELVMVLFIAFSGLLCQRTYMIWKAHRNRLRRVHVD